MSSMIIIGNSIRPPDGERRIYIKDATVAVTLMLTRRSMVVTMTAIKVRGHVVRSGFTGGGSIEYPFTSNGSMTCPSIWILGNGSGSVDVGGGTEFGVDNYASIVCVAA